MSELQNGVHIVNNTVYGMLNHITDYTGYSDQPAEQNGHYLALAFDTIPNEAEITIEVVGSGRPSKVMKSKDVVIRIADKLTEHLKLTVRNTTEDVSKIYEYSFKGLTLAE